MGAATGVTAHEDDFVPDIDAIAPARDATLAWDDQVLVVRAVDPTRDVRDEGRQERVIAEPHDLEIALAAITALRATRPWPALEVEWQWPDSDIVHRVVLHPRGVQHAVPRARDVLSSYERFGEHVAALFEHVPRRSRAPASLELTRGWLDDLVVPFEAMPALPALSRVPGPYRASAATEALVAYTDMPAALLPRVRHNVSRILTRSEAFDGLSALALSDHYVWVVKESGPVFRIPCAEMRGLFTEGLRFELVFGRSTFLSVTLPLRAPIRAALIDAAYDVAARLRTLSRLR